MKAKGIRKENANTSRQAGRLLFISFWERGRPAFRISLDLLLISYNCKKKIYIYLTGSGNYFVPLGFLI